VVGTGICKNAHLRDLDYTSRMASPGNGSVPLVIAEDVRLVLDGVLGQVCTMHSSNEVELLNRQILKLSQTDFLQPYPNGDHFPTWDLPNLSPLNSELRSELFTR
jgi:hypothetical protein